MKKLLVLGAALIVAAGCSSMKVNHDYDHQADFSQYATYAWHDSETTVEDTDPRLPALHYEVPELPEWIQIYGLHTDSDVRRDLNGLQVHAAKRALYGERDDKHTDRWIIVFGHQPVYNNGHHQNNANERRVRARLEKPLFEECGVHLYVAGHAHHQEHITAEGFEQVIQGASAKSKGRNKSPKLTSTTQRHFSREFGFEILEVDPVRLRLDFYDVLGTREKGEVVAPGPEDIFRSYSWCGGRGDVGNPASPARPCHAH